MWDTYDDKWNVRTLWNEYMTPPWNNWSIGLFDCMFTTPSQQAHESWHKQIMQSRIPGKFKGSTEQVFKVAIPELVKMDGILIPDKLLFSVPNIPLPMLKKAFWYLTRKESHLHVKTGKHDDGSPWPKFYMLSSKSKWAKITPLIVVRFEQLMDGKKPRDFGKLEQYMELVTAVHLVQYSDDAGIFTKY